MHSVRRAQTFLRPEDGKSSSKACSYHPPIASRKGSICHAAASVKPSSSIPLAIAQCLHDGRKRALSVAVVALRPNLARRISHNAKHEGAAVLTAQLRHAILGRVDVSVGGRGLWVGLHAYTYCSLNAKRHANNYRHLDYALRGC